MLAKAFGARVITTAGSAEKCEACRKLGADVAVNYKTEDFVAATKEATGGKGAELIVDMVGGDYIERNYEARRGRRPDRADRVHRPPKATVDFRRPDAKRLHHTGSTLRPRNRREGRDRARLRGEGLAADRGRQGTAGDRQDFSAARGCAAHALDGASQQSARSCSCSENRALNSRHPFARRAPRRGAVEAVGNPCSSGAATATHRHGQGGTLTPMAWPMPLRRGPRNRRNVKGLTRAPVAVDWAWNS